MLSEFLFVSATIIPYNAVMITTRVVSFGINLVDFNRLNIACTEMNIPRNQLLKEMLQQKLQEIDKIRILLDKEIS